MYWFIEGSYNILSSKSLQIAHIHCITISSLRVSSQDHVKYNEIIVLSPCHPVVFVVGISQLLQNIGLPVHLPVYGLFLVLFVSLLVWSYYW